jgi:hypothetical protein
MSGLYLSTRLLPNSSVVQVAEGFTHLALDVEVRLQTDALRMNVQKRLSLANNSDLP